MLRNTFIFATNKLLRAPPKLRQAVMPTIASNQLRQATVKCLSIDAPKLQKEE